MEAKITILNFQQKTGDKEYVVLVDAVALSSENVSDYCRPGYIPAGSFEAVVTEGEAYHLLPLGTELFPEEVT